MGARINFVFNDGTDHAVGFYSHWGADTWQEDLANAIRHAEPRLGDYSYWTRMVISYLIQDEVLQDTGYGIFAMGADDVAILWATENVHIDLVNKTVNGVSFDTFCNYGIALDNYRNA